MHTPPSLGDILRGKLIFFQQTCFRRKEYTLVWWSHKEQLYGIINTLKSGFIQFVSWVVIFNKIIKIILKEMILTIKTYGFKWNYKF